MYRLNIVDNNRIEIDTTLQKNDIIHKVFYSNIPENYVGKSIVYKVYKKNFIAFISAEEISTGKKVIFPFIKVKNGFRFLNPIDYITEIDYISFIQTDSDYTCIIANVDYTTVRRIIYKRKINCKWELSQKANISLAEKYCKTHILKIHGQSLVN